MEDELAGVGLVLEAPTGHGHMAPCLVKDMVDGSSSQACGTIAVGDILTSVDGVPVQGMSVEEIAGLIIGETGSKVLIAFESSGRELKGKPRQYSRRLTRGRAGGSYSASSSLQGSPTLHTATPNYKIPDIDPLGNAGDPGSRPASGTFGGLSSLLPEIPRLSLKNLRSPAFSQSARDDRESRPNWMRDDWVREDRPLSARTYEVSSSPRTAMTTGTWMTFTEGSEPRESALDRAIELTKNTRDEITRDLLVPHESVTKHTASTNRTTVGISYEERTGVVTALLVGGPAFNSRKVSKGDIIVGIDGHSVEGKSIFEKLVGSDRPGSVVVLSLKKTSGQLDNVRLQRKLSTLIADKRQLFEKFTKISDRAKNHNKDDTMNGYIDDAIELWTRMMIEEHDHDAKCEQNVERMQKACLKWLEELLSMLEKGNLDLSGQMQVRYAALELECNTSKSDLRAAWSKTLSVFRDVEVLQAEIGGNKRWAKAQILNARLEAEVSRRELADKDRLVHRRDEQLQEARKEAFRYQAEAEELRRELHAQQDSMRVLERNFARSESENTELREQKHLLEEMLKKAQEWNNQLGDRDASEIARLATVIKESESEILGLNKFIHELKLQLKKAVDDAESCRQETFSLQQIKVDLEQKVDRNLAAIETHRQTNVGMEEEIRTLNEQLRELQRRWHAERASLLQDAQKEKDSALAELRERMQQEFEFEREQLHASKKQNAGLQSEVSRLGELLSKSEQEWLAKFKDEKHVRSGLEAELENTRVALSNLRASHEQEVMRFRHDLDSARHILQLKDKDMNTLQAQVTKLTKENDILEQAGRDLRLQLDRLADELRAKELHFNGVQSELERVTRLLRDTQVEVERLRQICEEKEEQLRRLHAIIEKVTDELSLARTDLARRQMLEGEQANKAAETKYHLELLQQELTKTKHDMAVKMAATIADLQEELRAELRKTARQEVNMRQALERMRKLHLEGKQVLSEKIERLSNLAASLTEEVIELRSHDNEYESIIKALRVELSEVRQTKDQSIYSLQGSNRDLQAALDISNHRIHDLEQELHANRSELTMHRGENERLHGECSRWELESQQLREELAEKTKQLEKVTRPLESEILALNKQVHELHVALEKMTLKYQQATETLRKELDRVKLLQIEIDELRSRLGKLPEVERNLERELARGHELQRELERERSLRAPLDREIQSKDAELQKLRVQVINQQQEIKNQSQQVAHVTKELQKCTKEHADLKRTFEERERSLSADKKRLEVIIAAKDDELEKLRRQLLECRDKTNELNREIIILQQNQGDKDVLERYRKQLQEAWAAVRALDLQINHLQHEESERKSWVISKMRRAMLRVEETWNARLKVEITRRNDALRERDQMRTLLAEKDTVIHQLNEKDGIIRQLQAEIEHDRAQFLSCKFDLDSHRAQLNKANAALVDSELECERLREELAKQAKSLKAEMRALRSAPPPPPPPTPPMRDTAHLTRCREVMRLMLSKVQKLRLAQIGNVTASVSDSCTLGFSYVEQAGKETVVSHVLTGGPAFKSKRIHKGDFILLVDGAQVAGERMTEALKGNNTPGSKVKLTIRKGTTGKIESVELARVLTATIADKRRLFDLFCEIENSVTHMKDMNSGHVGKALAYVEDALNLWSRMELEQVVVDDKSAEDIADLQTTCDAWLHEAYGLLGHDLDGVKFVVSLDADLQTAASDRANFESQLCRDFAAAIDGNASKLHVGDLDFRNNTATVTIQPGVCGGLRTPAEASRELTSQMNDMSSLLRKGNYSKIARSITNIEAVQDEALTTGSPAAFNLFGSSPPTTQQGSPIAHETLFSSRRGSTPKGTEFSSRSPAKNPMDDAGVRDMVSSLDVTIQDLRSEISRKDGELERLKAECSDLSRKISEGHATTERSAADKNKLQSEVIRLQREMSLLRMSPSKELDLVKKDLMSALSERDSLSSSKRTLEMSYSDLQQAKAALDRKIDALEHENQNLKLRLSRSISPRQSSASELEAGSRLSPFAKDRPTEMANQAKAGEAGAGWNDGFFATFFGGKDEETTEAGDENWDDSYFMDLLGDDLKANRSPRSGQPSPPDGGPRSGQPSPPDGGPGRARMAM